MGEVEALPPLSELDFNKIHASPVIDKCKTNKDGAPIYRKDIELYYGEHRDGKKVSVPLFINKPCRTPFGVSTKYFPASMRIEIDSETRDQLNKLKSYLIRTFALPKSRELFPGDSGKVNNEDEFNRFLLNSKAPFIREPAEGTSYPAQFQAEVPCVKKGDQYELNTSICELLDNSDKPYNFMFLAGKTFKEVGMELVRMRVNKEGRMVFDVRFVFLTTTEEAPTNWKPQRMLRMAEQSGHDHQEQVNASSSAKSSKTDSNAPPDKKARGPPATAIKA